MKGGMAWTGFQKLAFFNAAHMFASHSGCLNNWENYKRKIQIATEEKRKYVLHLQFYFIHFLQ